MGLHQSLINDRDSPPVAVGRILEIEDIIIYLTIMSLNELRPTVREIQSVSQLSHEPELDLAGLASVPGSENNS